MNRSGAEAESPSWTALYKVGGLSTLVACALEIAAVFLYILFSGTAATPGSPPEWFALLHSHRLIGLLCLGVLDLATIALMSMMFLALCVALRKGNESSMAIAGGLAFLGIAVYLATNTVVPMTVLSDQYAAVTTDAQRALFVAAGHAVLATGGVGTGAYMAFLLMGSGGLVISVVMLRTNIFGRVVACLGILANAATLAYYVATPVAPSTSVFLLWGSGLLSLAWMMPVGWRLIRLK